MAKQDGFYWKLPLYEGDIYWHGVYSSHEEALQNARDCGQKGQIFTAEFENGKKIETRQHGTIDAEPSYSSPDDDGSLPEF